MRHGSKKDTWKRGLILTKTVKVFNLLTEEEQYFLCDPTTVVKSAYAHSNGLSSQWATTQGEMELPVLTNGRVVTCGDWSARLDR